MNVLQLRAEWRAVRRAGFRLMHHSLSLVGLAAMAVGVVVCTHPEHARALGARFLPHADGLPAFSLGTMPDAMSSALAETGGNAGRMLGLAETSAPASPASSVAPVSAPVVRAETPVVAVAPTVTMRKVVADQRSARDGTRDNAREKREAVAFLAKKYRVNPNAIAILVDAAYVTGRELDLDPLLLLSVMAIESGFNPFAESTAGASGLMQVMSKVHRDKFDDFGGSNIALNPVVNLRVGAVVLKDCIRRGGSVEGGLRLYVGAGTGSDSGYGARVLQEKDRLVRAARGAGAVRSSPVPVVTARVRQPVPDIDHRFDTVDPSTVKVDPAAGRVAAL